jgi:hypothetical protein
LLTRDEARRIAVGTNNHLTGLNNQATTDHFGIISARFFIYAAAERMPEEKNEPEFEGLVPSTLFREFAAECMELAQTASSPEKRGLYLKMASVWHQMAQRWEKKG